MLESIIMLYSYTAKMRVILTKFSWKWKLIASLSHPHQVHVIHTCTCTIDDYLLSAVVFVIIITIILDTLRTHCSMCTWWLTIQTGSLYSAVSKHNPALDEVWGPWEHSIQPTTHTRYKVGINVSNHDLWDVNCMLVLCMTQCIKGLAIIQPYIHTCTWYSISGIFRLIKTYVY